MSTEAVGHRRPSLRTHLHTSTCTSIHMSTHTGAHTELGVYRSAAAVEGRAPSIDRRSNGPHTRIPRARSHRSHSQVYVWAHAHARMAADEHTCLHTCLPTYLRTAADGHTAKLGAGSGTGSHCLYAILSNMSSRNSIHAFVGIWHICMDLARMSMHVFIHMSMHVFIHMSTHMATRMSAFMPGT